MRGAWKSQGTNQRELVHQLRSKGIIRTDTIETVMEKVDRGNYCFLRPKHESESKHLCYTDRALSIGLGQTISAPHMHAYALEELYPSVAAKIRQEKEGVSPKILDVGCGSGYLTACLGRWLQQSSRATTSRDKDKIGKVFGIDVRKDLVEMTRQNVERADGDLLADGVVHLSVRDGWKGLPEHAPFDAIHVGAAATSLPKILANQLKVGGVLIIPIGPQEEHQVLYKIKRVKEAANDESRCNNNENYYASEEPFRRDDFEVRPLLGVRYVPLVKGEEL